MITFHVIYMILFNGKTCYMHFNIAHNPLITEGTKKEGGSPLDVSKSF